MLAVLAGLAIGASDPQILVLPTFVAGAKAPDSMLDEAVLTVVDQTTRLKAVGPSDINALLGRQALKDAVGCNDITCYSDLSGALGARYLVLVSVSQSRSGWTVAAKLIDTDGGGADVKSRELTEVRGDRSALIRALPGVARPLIAKAGLPLEAGGGGKTYVLAMSAQLLGKVHPPGPCEGAIAKQLAAIRMQQVDHRTSAVADTPAALEAFAHKESVDFVLRGQTSASSVGKIMGTSMYSVRGVASVVVVDARSGEVVANQTKSRTTGGMELTVEVVQASSGACAAAAQEIQKILRTKYGLVPD